MLGDPATLGHVFHNLIENALKFHRPGTVPVIEVGTRTESERVVFFVKDAGIGIEPQYHDTVFRLFDRLDPSVDGSGVGLALVKRIVENHGGRVWVESDRYSGCTMCFVVRADRMVQRAGGSDEHRDSREVPVHTLQESGSRVKIE